MTRIWLVALLAACGDDIASQLVRVSDEPPGEHCAAGGSAVAVGVDRDQDGVLDDSEVDSVEYVCNGPAGPSGMQVLVDTHPEPVGANCPHGGIAVTTGLDADGDGVLDATEVQHTAYVCNGDDAVATLLVTRSEPPGQNCALGGTALVVGRDRDADGTLDPDEVTSTSFVCNTSAVGTLDGNFVINTELDIALLAGITNINGGLTSFQGVRDIALPDLQTVGAILLQGGGDVNLPALRSVVQGASLNCSTAELPVLETVGGRLEVGTFPGLPTQLVTLDLPALRTIGGDFFAFGPLTRITAPRLESFANWQQSFQELLDLQLPALRTVATLQLPAPRLPVVEFPQLTTATNIFINAANATSLAVPALADVSGRLFISGGSLPALSLGALTHVGELHIDGVSALTRLDAPLLASIDGPVTIIAPNLPICQIDAILAQAGYTGPRTILAAPCP